MEQRKHLTAAWIARIEGCWDLPMRKKPVPRPNIPYDHNGLLRPATKKPPPPGSAILRRYSLPQIKYALGAKAL